jgi:Outer membrane protein beta-barrel family/Carboxypeptidase regulatory-like domain
MKKAIMKITAAIWLTCLINNSYAQTIKVTGAVNDNISKQVLPNATVTIKSISDNKFNTSVITNNNGSFLITVPQAGLYQIEASYLGYQNNTQDSVLIDEQHTGINAFYMLLEGKNLKTVTVSAAKKPFITMGANKITLNVAQSAIAAGGNAYDVLKKAPGMTEQNDALNFRGKSINVLINGRPSNLSGEELKNMLTNMQASAIEKIEILPNPSAKYDATGGSVVNIVLAKNKLFGTNYILTTGIGTGKNLRGSMGLDINHRAKNINVFGGYNFKHETQYYKTNSTRYLNTGTIAADEYDVRERNNHSYKLGVDYDINKYSGFGALINGYVNYRNRDVTNTAVLHHTDNIYDSASKVFTNGKAIFNNPAVNLYYKTTLDSIGKELTINADYLNYNKTWYNNFANRYYNNKGMEYVSPDFLKDNSPARINVYAFTIDFVMPTKKAKWEAGLKTNYTINDNDIVWQKNDGTGFTIDAGKTNHFIYKENVNAAYLNYIRTIKKLSLQAGLRVEQTNTSGNSVTSNQIDKNSYVDFFPNLSIDYTKNEKNIFNLSYRKSTERYGLGFVNPAIIYQNRYNYFQGNPYLKASKTNSLSLAYSHGDAYMVGVDMVYAKKSISSVYKNIGNNIVVQSYDNLSNAVSVMPYINLSKQLGVWSSNWYASAGYVNFIGTASNNNKTNNESWPFMASVENSFSLKHQWAFELSGSYTSPISMGVAYYHYQASADFGVSKQLLKNKLNLKLSVNDIFNTEKSIADVNTSLGLIQSISKIESRFINLSVKYKFGNSNVKAKNNRKSKLSDIQSRIN